MSPIIRVHPGKARLDVPSGTSLLEALQVSGHYLESHCGGRGTCGRCVVHVLAGDLPTSEKEKEYLGEEAFMAGYRLACLHRVEGDVTVRVLAELPAVPESWTEVFSAHRSSDTVKEVGDSGYYFQTGKTKIFLGRVSRVPIGVALDGGTTSLEVLFVDLVTGRVVATERRMNRQVSMGADVVSRIQFALLSGENAFRLRKLFVDSINDCLVSFLGKSGFREEDLVVLVLSGNMFITYSFLGLDMKPLSRFPFAPPFEETLTFDEEGALSINRSGAVILFPAPGIFVGGDAVAGATALDFDRGGPPSLFIDIGTNTEIVLRKGEELFVTSVPSGGAFEGASIRFGMLALDGAIHDVRIGEGVSLSVVGEGEPRGISGSGLISLVAELLKAGLLDRTGRFLSRSEAEGKGDVRHLWRIAEMEGEAAFVLTAGERGTPPVYLLQGDVRNFQTAKSAARSAIEVLLDRAGIPKGKIESVSVGGAFGKGVRTETLFETGIFPEEFRGKVRKVGNASLRGGYRTLTERDFLGRATECARRMQVVSLGGEKDFEAAFLRFLDF